MKWYRPAHLMGDHADMLNINSIWVHDEESGLLMGSHMHNNRSRTSRPDRSLVAEEIPQMHLPVMHPSKGHRAAPVMQQLV